MGFQILVLLFEQLWLSVSDGYLRRKERNTIVQSRSWGSSSPSDKRLGAIILHCQFWPLFNTPKKLFQKVIYGIRTVWANRKQMPKMIDHKQMKTGDCEFSGNKMACKRVDNRSVLLLSSPLKGINDILSV